MGANAVIHALLTTHTSVVFDRFRERPVVIHVIHRCYYYYLVFLDITEANLSGGIDHQMCQNR